MPILTDKQVAGYKSLVENRFASQQDTLKLIAHYEATIENLKAQLPQKVELPKEVAEALGNLISSRVGPEDADYLLWSLMQCPGENEEEDDEFFIRKSVNENYVTSFDIAKALMYGYTVKEEPTVEDQLRTSWTPKVEKLLADYIGDAAPKVTREIIDGIMPLTREVLKAVEVEEGK